MTNAWAFLALPGVAALLSTLPGAAGLLRPSTPRNVRRRAPVLRDTYNVEIKLPDGSTESFPCADDEFILDAAEEVAGGAEVKL